MCFGCSEEPSHRDGSFEYPQHMFWLRNKKSNLGHFLAVIQLRTLIWGPVKGTATLEASDSEMQGIICHRFDQKSKEKWMVV